MAGLFLLEDPQTSRLPLPDRYGIDDIPGILQDKRFTGDGQLDFGEPAFSPIGRLGADMLVNGTHDPHLNIRHQRVRLRLLNASTARSYNIGFTDDRPFDLIASDGGLLERPHRTTRVPLSPGERAELVAVFQPSERVVLRSFPPELGTGLFEGRFAGADDTFDLLQVRAGAALTPAPPVPDRLANHQRLEAAAATKTRRLELNGSSRINGQSMDPGRIDQAVTVDTTELWEVANRSGNLHNFHVHGVQFMVLEYRGRRAAAAPGRLEGHRVPAVGRHHAAAGSLHRLQRPGPALHVPLPPAAPRGQRHDGPARRRPTRPGAHQPAHPPQVTVGGIGRSAAMAMRQLAATPAQQR